MIGSITIGRAGRRPWRPRRPPPARARSSPGSRRRASARRGCPASARPPARCAGTRARGRRGRPRCARAWPRISRSKRRSSPASPCASVPTKPSTWAPSCAVRVDPPRLLEVTDAGHAAAPCTAASSRGSAWRLSQTKGDVPSWLCRRATGTRSARATSRDARLRVAELAGTDVDARARSATARAARRAGRRSRRDAAPARPPGDAGPRPAARTPGPRSTARSTARASSSAKQSESSAAIDDDARAAAARRGHRSSITCPFWGSTSPSLRARRIGQRRRVLQRGELGAQLAVLVVEPLAELAGRGELVADVHHLEPEPDLHAGRAAPAPRPAAVMRRAMRLRMTRTQAARIAGGPHQRAADRAARARAAPARSWRSSSSRSTIRRRALRARGFAAISSRRRTTPAAAVRMRTLARPAAGAARQPRRAEARRRPAAERVLHASILEGVVGEHREAPARPEQRPAVGEQRARARPARRSPGCGSPGTSASPGCSPGVVRPTARATVSARASVDRERTGAHDGARDGARARLLAQLRDGVGERALVPRVDDRRGGERGRAGSMRMSSGPAWRKLKPRAGVVELERAHARDRAGSRRRPSQPSSASAAAQVGVRSAGGAARVSPKGARRSRGQGQRLGIAIDAEELRVGSGLRAGPRHGRPRPTVASTRRAPGRGRSPLTTCPTITGTCTRTWAAPSGPVSVSSSVIGGSSPRLAAALPAVTSAPPSSSARPAARDLRRALGSAGRSDARKSSSPRPLVLVLTKTSCHTCLSQMRNLSTSPVIITSRLIPA